MSRTLSIALSDNALTRPILDGVVRAQGIAWTPLAVHPSELFWRQLHFGDFDVFEMSLSTCLRLASLGELRWVALPVFTARTLAQLAIVVSERAGIESPADLAGRRIGVPDYQQTSAVWSRGVLEHDFGVAPADVEWVMERGASRSHGHATGFEPPAGVSVEVMDESDSIGEMLAQGRLDGSLLYLSQHNLVDRSPARSMAELGIRPLFDPRAELARWADAPRHAMHCVAVSRELADACPWALLNIYQAFIAAKEHARTVASRAITPWVWADGAVAAADQVISQQDPAPFGIAANVTMLERLAALTAEQGIATRPVDLGEVFAGQTMHT